MKAHTNEYKTKIKEYGRQIDALITYEDNEQTIELGGEKINSITLVYKGDILKSVMKELDFECSEEIPLNTEINFAFGVKTGNDYEYINYGNFIVYKAEKQEDQENYKLICYDKMLYSMVDYESMNITYPITIRSYIGAICSKLGLTFANASETFANYNKEIQSELYLDSDGNSLGYTFRDVLDELAQATASTICINSDDELEVRYINDTAPEVTNGLDISAIEQKTENGITCTYDSDSQTITFNGVCTGETYFAIEDSYRVTRKNSQWLPKLTAYYVGGEATGYCGIQSGSEYIDFQELNGENPLITLTHRVGGTKYTSFGFYQGDTANNYTIRIFVADEVYEEYPLRESISEEYLKNINVNFGEKYGPVNSIVLSRAGGSDNVYLRDEESVAQNGLCEIKISDNQIMNFNDRSEYLPDILNQLDGLQYYINDFSSTGITYLDLCDKYNVTIGNNTYTCILFNDEINITQGLEENIYTEIPQESETDYTKADKTDRKINQTYLMVDKQNGIIQSLVDNTTYVSDTKSGVGSITLENAYEGQLYKLSIKGQIDLLFPQSGLYPSSDLFTIDSILKVDNDEYKLDIDYLNYINNEICDEFIYENGDCKIIRRVGVDNQGNKYALTNETTEERNPIYINVKQDSTILLKSFDNAILSATYLLQNTFTDNFATEVYVNSSITQTASQITEQVNAKVGDDEIVAKLNLAIEDGQGIVNLTGNQVTIDSDNFKLSADGSVQANNGQFSGDITSSNATITGGNLEMTSNHTNPKLTLNGTAWGNVASTNSLVCDGFIVNADGTNCLTARVNKQVIGSSAGYGGYINVKSSLESDWASINNDGFSTGTAGYPNAYMYSDGDVYAITYSGGSLESIKKNIEKYQDEALTLINGADIYKYNFKTEDDNTKKHIGLIIADGDTKYNTPVEILNKDKNGVELYSMISVAWQAIKEQQKIIEDLQQRVEKLEKESDK